MKIIRLDAPASFQIQGPVLFINPHKLKTFPSMMDSFNSLDGGKCEFSHLYLPLLFFNKHDWINADFYRSINSP